MIFEYMEKNNLSKEEFCKCSGIKKTALDKMLSGKDFYLLNLFLLAIQLNVEMRDLLIKRVV